MNKRAGFTLIELVMVIMLVSLFSTIVANLMGAMITKSQLGFNLQDLDSKVRESMERITRDIRQISPTRVTTMTSSHLVFTDQAGNSIDYSYTLPSLTRNSKRLVTDIGSFAFSYLDGNGITTATAANVRYILIAVMFQLTDSAGTVSSPIYYTTVAVQNGV